MPRASAVRESTCSGKQSIAGKGDSQFQAVLSASAGLLTAADASGTTYAFAADGDCQMGQPSNAVTSLATKIEDRNGNVMTFSSYSDCKGDFTFQDTLGRAAISSNGFGASGNRVTISGLQSPYVLSWETVSASGAPINSKIVTNNGCVAFPRAAGVSGNVVSSILLPNQQSFSFAYDSQYGLLSQVTYPSGVYVSYAYTNNPLAAAFQYNKTGGNGSS